MTYDPLTGDGWDQEAAAEAWAQSMDRTRYEAAPARWTLQGKPGTFYWRYFNFRPYTGNVTIRGDGFHWRTRHYDTGDTIHSGVTTSLYEAYQSVEQNQPVKYEPK
jgi:hypothetical protein